MSKAIRRSLLAAAVAAFVAAPLSAAEIVPVNFDPPGAGLNDPTPAAPLGGNPGATIGEQRQIAYLFAAELWGNVLESDAPVFVGASFQPLACSATGGVLGSAGTTFIFSDFAAGVVPDTWYGSALADAIAGADLNPGFIDINSRFNANLGTPGCLENSGWYYGLDGNTPPGQINFLNVVMHEIGHGLGFQGFAGPDGSFFLGRKDIYSFFAADSASGATFPALTQAERAATIVSGDGLVWTGPNVTGEAALVLDERTVLRATAPAAVAGDYAFGTAVFGPAATPANFAGELAVALDGGAVATDGCEPITSNVAGAIALVDRGTCAFSVKAANVQAAGAVGMLVANNQPGIINMAGSDPSITIPSLSVTQADGAALRAAVPVQLGLVTDPSLLQGADGNGLVRLYAPSPYQGGSSFSHFDVSLSPNALMEPSITTTLAANLNLDLTPALYADIGWVRNPGNADIAGCDTGVDAVSDGGLVVGASIAARSLVCGLVAPNQGQYQRCIVDYANGLRDAGLISGAQKGQVTACAATTGGGF